MLEPTSPQVQRPQVILVETYLRRGPSDHHASDSPELETPATTSPWSRRQARTAGAAVGRQTAGRASPVVASSRQPTSGSPGGQGESYPESTVGWGAGVPPQEPAGRRRGPNLAGGSPLPRLHQILCATSRCAAASGVCITLLSPVLTQVPRQPTPRGALSPFANAQSVPCARDASLQSPASGADLHAVLSDSYTSPPFSMGILRYVGAL